MWYHCDVAGSPHKKFINAGIWVSCSLFLAVALLAAVLTAVFAVINTTTNPVEPIAGVFGLYVWNSIAGSANSRHHTGPQTSTLHTHRSLCCNKWNTIHYSVKCHLFSTGVSSALNQLFHRGGSLKFCCGTNMALVLATFHKQLLHFLVLVWPAT